MLSAGMQKAKWVSEESLTRIQQNGVAKIMQILRLLSIPA
jgi:hypothetical protein